MHLHGELLKVRSTHDQNDIIYWEEDLNLGDLCAKGYQLRPHIVWFGEAVPLLETAAALTATADILIIIGTSMQVYPAASLIGFVSEETPIYFIDPKPNIHPSDFKNLSIISETATKGVPTLAASLIDNLP